MSNYPCQDDVCAVLRKQDCLNAAKCRKPLQEFPRRMGTCGVCGRRRCELRRGMYANGNPVLVWHCAECARDPHIVQLGKTKSAGWFWPAVEWVFTRLCLPWYLVRRARGRYRTNKQEIT